MAAVLIGASLAAQPTWADVVTIGPSKDNTLYMESGSLSNGAGENFFAGHTGVLTNTVRRAVIAFDIAGNVPSGATIGSVTLTLHLSRAALGAPKSTIELHRLLADWGEGTSKPLGPGGGGAPATPDDATWKHMFFNTSFWATAGGDFSPTTSASRTVIGVAFYTWGPSAQLAADVQDWLDNPASNFGWLLRATDEVTLQTARGFDSRQSLAAANRPTLTVSFTPPAATGAGRVPDGNSVPGTPFIIAHAAGGMITLNWGDSCLLTDNEFEVYEGTLLQPFSYNHLFNLCATGGPSATIMPAPGSTYYFVVPTNGVREGSYGTDSTGNQRPPGAPACLGQAIAACP